MGRRLQIYVLFTGLALTAGACNNAETEPSTASVPAIQEAPLPNPPLAPRSKTLSDPDLPFEVRYPPYLRRGLEAPEEALGVASSLVSDRNNAMLFSNFGAALPPDALGAALAVQIPEDGPDLTKHQADPILFSLDLRPEDIPENQVAGEAVSARRYFFSLGGSTWEISCQHTTEFRAKMIAACDQVASTIETK